MSKNLTILFVPVEGVGHVNACIGLAECLRDRGHKIVFTVDKTFEGKLIRYGFIEEKIINPNEGKFKNPGEEFAKHFMESGIFSGMSSLEKIELMSKQTFFIEMIDKMKLNEPKLKAIIEKHKPDVYIIDHIVGSPTLIYSDKPWIFLFSGNPLFVLDDERTPPGTSGYPSNGDKNEWQKFRKVSRNLFENARTKYNQWLVENGFPPITQNRCIPDSPFLNLYGYPEELDYTDIRPLPDKWFRVDALMRKGEEDFKLPEKFSKNKDKLIYLSLGSMGSIDVKLMKRLVEILAKSPHKFIVSKGPLHDKYELADNMWGERSVPQTKVIPLVDLVITHGGNNTVTETFSFGKPMIVMPLFGDQFDNAQRIDEKGFGIRLDIYNFKEEELLTAIEKLLNDEVLKKRLAAASNRMLNSDSLVKASELIEKLVK